MTDVLLDTHSFMWFIEGNLRLSQRARGIIASADTRRFLSIASLWEMAIKISIGRLESYGSFDTNVRTMLDRNHITLLDVTLEDVDLIAMLPFHHRDPFDRMLIAQALTRHMPVVSVDARFDTYGVERIG